VHFNHLRQKIDPERTGLIRTEPRIGYRLLAAS
jgi:DNA-binding response OmpR family regulator